MSCNQGTHIRLLICKPGSLKMMSIGLESISVETAGVDSSMVVAGSV